jgi:hypothetical protein
MTLEPHPHIKMTTVEMKFQPNGEMKPVQVVYTDLQLSNLHPDYKAGAVEELVGEIQAFQKACGVPDVRLRTF